MTRPRWAAAVFFVAYAAAVTWPGALPFNRIRPLILGMPLSMVWVALWLLLAFGALLLLDRAETRDEERRRSSDPGARGAAAPDRDGGAV